MMINRVPALSPISVHLSSPFVQLYLHLSTPLLRHSPSPLTLPFSVSSHLFLFSIAGNPFPLPIRTPLSLPFFLTSPPLPPLPLPLSPPAPRPLSSHLSSFSSSISTFSSSSTSFFTCVIRYTVNAMGAVLQEKAHNFIYRTSEKKNLSTVILLIPEQKTLGNIILY